MAEFQSLMETYNYMEEVIVSYRLEWRWKVILKEQA